MTCKKGFAADLAEPHQVLYRKVLAFLEDGHTITSVKLLDQVRQKLRAGHYAYRTEQAYVHWIVRFIHWHTDIHRRWRHPAETAG